MLLDCQNPPQRSPAGFILEKAQGSWWVARVLPRQEKALARDLLRASISYFLPMYTVVRSSRGRSWKATLPLFPGYVFVCGQEPDRSVALATGRIATLIAVHDQAGLVSELAAILRLTESGLAMDPYPALGRGSRCRVRSGPLQGVEGKVVRRKCQTRFVVDVTILGQGVTAEIDGSLLELAD